jgi:hypothetical protein
MKTIGPMFLDGFMGPSKLGDMSVWHGYLASVSAPLFKERKRKPLKVSQILLRVKGEGSNLTAIVGDTRLHEKLIDHHKGQLSSASFPIRRVWTWLFLFFFLM